MKLSMIVVALILVACRMTDVRLPTQTEGYERQAKSEDQPKQDRQIFLEPNRSLIQPLTPHGYGPGVNSDAAGKPFTYQPNADPLLHVTPNAYGPGAGMDQYGRRVVPK